VAGALEVGSLTLLSLFEVLVLIAVCVSTAELIAYDYQDREGNTQYNQDLKRVGEAVNVFFILECLLKITAMGLVMQKDSYLRTAWHWIDLVLAVSG